MKKQSRTSQNRAEQPAALPPPVVEQLIARFICEPDAGQIARAFTKADALLTNPNRLGDLIRDYRNPACLMQRRIRRSLA